MRPHVTDVLLQAAIAAGMPEDPTLVNPAAAVALPDGSTLVLIDTSEWAGSESYAVAVADEEGPTEVAHYRAHEVDDVVASILDSAAERVA